MQQSPSSPLLYFPCQPGRRLSAQPLDMVRKETLGAIVLYIRYRGTYS